MCSSDLAFTWSGTDLTWAVVVYGFVASVLPVWMLLAPRDYLSAFMKVGTILVLSGVTREADVANASATPGAVVESIATVWQRLIGGHS